MAITPTQWARLYAKAWCESAQGDPTFQDNLERDPVRAIHPIRAQFEKDPAATLPQIVADIRNVYNVPIDYNPGVTRILDLGLPPKKDSDPKLLSSIENDADAKQYRHTPKYCG